MKEKILTIEMKYRNIFLIINKFILPLPLVYITNLYFLNGSTWLRKYANFTVIFSYIIFSLTLKYFPDRIKIKTSKSLVNFPQFPLIFITIPWTIYTIVIWIKSYYYHIHAYDFLESGISIIDISNNYFSNSIKYGLILYFILYTMYFILYSKISTKDKVLALLQSLILPLVLIGVGFITYVLMFFIGIMMGGGIIV